MLADSGRPNRSVSMIAANAAFDFERTVPSSILTNLANDCVIVSEESAKYKTRQMLKTVQSPNILPAKFSRYTVVSRSRAMTSAYKNGGRNSGRLRETNTTGVVYMLTGDSPLRGWRIVIQ